MWKWQRLAAIQLPLSTLRRLSTAGAGAGKLDPRRDAISSAYRRAIQLPRPATIEWRGTEFSFTNFVSLVGSVDSPVKPCTNETTEKFRVKTHLRVDQPRRDGSPGSFRVILRMRDELAKVSLEYLKPRDFIYVSGFLSNYDRVSDSGENEIYYFVNVEELNFVSGRTTTDSVMKAKCCEVEDAAAEDATAEDATEKIDRLRLWQIFLANPYEWWDNRENKKNPKAPDFKHKDTKECLWIQKDDPPWIKKQLELLDESAGDFGFNKEHARSRVRMSEWQFDD